MPETGQDLQSTAGDLKKIIREAQAQQGQGLNLDVHQTSDNISGGGTGIGAIVGHPNIVHNDYRSIADPHTSENSWRNLVGDLPRECAPGYLESIWWAPKTCDWLLQEDRFKQWLQGGEETQILWLHGGSGTGKTVLSAYIIHHLKERIENNNKKRIEAESKLSETSDSIADTGHQQQKAEVSVRETLAYCFSDPSDSTRSTASGILGALLRKLIGDHWIQLQQAKIGFADQLKLASSNTSALSGILLTVLKDLGQHFSSIFLVIDGLDSCDSTSGKLFIRSLYWLLGATKAKLLVASQPIDWIGDELDIIISTTATPSAVIKFDIEPSIKEAGAIDAVIRHRFANLNLQRHVGEEIKDKLQDYIMKESGDTFLWADLMIKHLEVVRGALKGLEFDKILERFRGTLEDAYSRILSDICRRRVENRLTLDEVEFVLQLVVAAKRQLTAAEIDMAYAIWKAGDRAGASGVFPNPNKIQTDIYVSCIPLVSFNSETKIVALLHKSVADYLLNSRSYFWLRMVRLIVEVLLPVISVGLSRYFAVMYLQLIPALFPLGALSGRGVRNSSELVKSSSSSSSAVTRQYEHTLKMANSLVFDVCLRSLRARRLDTDTKEDGTSCDLNEAPKPNNSNGEPSEEESFVQYVTRYWKDHALAVDPRWAISRFSELCDHPNITQLRDDLLLRAAKDGRFEVLKILLGEIGASITAKDDNGMGALHLAAFGGYLEAVKLLLNHGADLSGRDRIGATAIHWAARGAQPETFTCLFNLYQEQKDRERHKGALVRRWLTWLGSHFGLPGWPGKGLPDFEMPDDEGGTLLAWAVEGGSEKVVQFLIDNGAKTNFRYLRDTRRMYGDRMNSLDEFEDILQLIFDMVEPNRRQRTPLSRAAECGHQNLVELLLHHGADPNFEDLAKRTAVFWAAKQGRESIIRTLKAAGANCHSQLLRAVIARDTVAARNLVHIGEADPNSLVHEDLPTLCFAAVVGDKSVMEALLESPRADINVKSRNLRFTPLVFAAAYNEVTVAEYLITKGADVNYQPGRGATALQWAIIEGSTAVMETILASGKANLSLTDWAGGTALRNAAARGNLVGFKQLFEKDKNVNLVDLCGRSVIFHAIRGRSWQIIDLLLSDPSVDTVKTDFYGATPLSMAARFGDNQAIHKLLQRENGTGAQCIVARDKFGRTPIMWAALKGHSSTRNILLKHCKTVGLSPGDDEFTPVMIPNGSQITRYGRKPRRSGFCDVCCFDVGEIEPYYGCGKCFGGVYNWFVCCLECWETLTPRPHCLQRGHQLTLRSKSKENESS